jgi:hypothetical protein
LQDGEDPFLGLGRHMFVDAAHAAHLLTEADRAADLGDPIIGQPRPVAVPPFVEGEARQDRRDPLAHSRVV